MRFLLFLLLNFKNEEKALPFSSFLKVWSTKSRKSIVFLDIFTRQIIKSLKKHCLYKVLAPSSSQTIGFLSYWIPTQIWCNILCWLPCLLLWSLLCRIPIRIWCNILSWLPCGHSLLTSQPNMMHYPVLAALPRAVVVSYWILIQILSNILSWLSCLLRWSFLIEFPFKYDAVSSVGCLTSSRIRLLLSPWSNIMQYPLLAALPHPAAWLPCLLLWAFLIETLL